MNIALFGGTFDPIHAGHLRAAQAAARRFRLDRILFVPSGKPPHKVHDHLTSFAHRYGMVALACAGRAGFVPSMLEAPRADGRPHYSITTVRRVKRSIGRRDRLYFLIGVDAFLDLPEWKAFRELLDSVNFIVVSRPGYSNREIVKIVPPELVRRSGSRQEKDTIALRHSAVHILRGVDVPVASSDIRECIRDGRRVAGLVPPLVEEYMRKEGLYRPARGAGQKR